MSIEKKVLLLAVIINMLIISCMTPPKPKTPNYEKYTLKFNIDDYRKSDYVNDVSLAEHKRVQLNFENIMTDCVDEEEIITAIEYNIIRKGHSVTYRKEVQGIVLRETIEKPNYDVLINIKKLDLNHIKKKYYLDKDEIIVTNLNYVIYDYYEIFVEAAVQLNNNQVIKTISRRYSLYDFINKMKIRPEFDVTIYIDYYFDKDEGKWIRDVVDCKYNSNFTNSNTDLQRNFVYFSMENLIEDLNL